MKYAITFGLLVVFMTKADENYHPCSDGSTKMIFECDTTKCPFDASTVGNIETIKYSCKPPNGELKLNIDELKKYPMLRELDVSSLELQKFSVSSGSVLNNVKKFKATHNNFTQVHDLPFNSMPDLDLIDFSFNTVWYFSLNTLNENNKITAVICTDQRVNQIGDDAFVKMKNLEYLDMNNNNIPKILENHFTTNKKLKHINLSVNPFDEIKEGTFRNCLDLEWLDISNTKIRSIHAETFKNNARLKYLNLRFNQITQFSYNIFSTRASVITVRLPAKNLTDLDISCAHSICHFDHFDESDSFDNLHVFNVSNYLTQEPFSKLFEKISPSLVTLDLSWNSIETLDSSVLHRFPELKNLFMRHLKLTTIKPDAFLRQVNLRFLDLSDNMLSNIDWNKLKMNELRLDELNLEGNGLTTIKQILNKFPRLRSLAISRNRLSCGYLEFVLENYKRQIEMIQNPTDHSEHRDGIDCHLSTGKSENFQMDFVHNAPKIMDSQSSNDYYSENNVTYYFSDSKSDYGMTKGICHCKSCGWLYIVLGIQSIIIVLLIVWLVFRVRCKRGSPAEHSVAPKNVNNVNPAAKKRPPPRIPENDYEELVPPHPSDYVTPNLIAEPPVRRNIVNELQRSPLPRYLPMRDIKPNK